MGVDNMKVKKYSFKFEPQKPITNPKEFTNELIKYCDDNKMDLFIHHEGMEPIVTIENIQYIAILEIPKILDIPYFPIYYTKSYGYKWVYLYKYEK